MSLETRNQQNTQQEYGIRSPTDSKSIVRAASSSKVRYLYVDSDWLAEHLFDAKLKVIEVDLEPDTAYVQGHIPGAYLLSWNEDLSSKTGTDILSRQDFERLMSIAGVTHDTEIVLYSDSDNLLAVFAFWIFQYYGHDKVKILSGGRDNWTESGRLFTRIAPPRGKRSEYFIGQINRDIRPDFLKASQCIKHLLAHADSDDPLQGSSYAE